MSHREETPGQTQNLLEGLYNLSALVIPQGFPGGGVKENVMNEWILCSSFLILPS